MRFFLLFLIVCTLFSCSNQNKKQQTIIDPNDSSEMALMMRDMFFKLNDIKSKIQSGQDISYEQLRFSIIHESEATDDSFLNNGLTLMSKAFEQKVIDFNNYPSVQNYTEIVNNCISCHQGMCPGPLQRIDNLILEKKR